MVIPLNHYINHHIITLMFFHVVIGLAMEDGNGDVAARVGYIDHRGNGPPARAHRPGNETTSTLRIWGWPFLQSIWPSEMVMSGS